MFEPKREKKKDLVIYVSSDVTNTIFLIVARLNEK